MPAFRSVACAGPLAVAAAIVAGVLGCDPPPTQIPPGPAAIPSPPIADRPVEPPPPAPIEDTREAGDGAAAEGEGGEPAGGEESAPVTGGGGSSPPASGSGKGVRDGGACERAEECASGICEGQGCGASSKGVCMSQNRRCTRDLRAFCGCDGQTFRASGSCPGRRYSARAACK